VRAVSDPIEELRDLAAAARPAPAVMDGYLAKVHERAYTILDRDVESLKAAGLSEDEIFEHTVAAALAEGLRRLDCAEGVIR
jgi:alkylhydroperoxidase family enzyme